MSPSPKGLRLAFVIGGAVLAALLLTLGVVYAVVTSQRTPQLTAAAFLDEVVAGDATAALQQVTGLAPASRGLLGDDMFASATDRITGYTIDEKAIELDTTAGTASVVVDVVQGDETYTQNIELVRVSRDVGLFDVWRVSAASLPTVAFTYSSPDTMGLAVNGTELSSLDGSGSYRLPVLPGTYDFEATGVTEWVTADPAVAIARFDNSPVIEIPVVLSEAGTASAQSAVDATLDACIAQATLAPQPNCGFFITQDDATYTNIRWSLVTRPTVSFSPYTAGRGWEVVSESSGSMRMDADFTRGSESGTAEGSVDNFSQAGWITSVTEEGTALFESVTYE